MKDETRAAGLATFYLSWISLIAGVVTIVVASALARFGHEVAHTIMLLLGFGMMSMPVGALTALWAITTIDEREETAGKEGKDHDQDHQGRV